MNESLREKLDVKIVDDLEKEAVKKESQMGVEELSNINQELQAKLDL